VFRIHFLMHADQPQSQGLDYFPLGEHTSQLIPLVPDERALCHPLGFLSLSLDCFLPRLLHGFAVARDSHVSYPRSRAATLFPKYVLMEPSSVAIWHKNKTAMGIATGLWVINAAFLTYGEFSPLYPLGILTDVI
jgi:hypothetical protein